MPTTYDFNELMDRRSATSHQGGRGCVRVYRLITNPRITEADAHTYVTATQTLEPAGLNVGSTHPVDTGIVVTSTKIEDEAADGKQWLCTIEWAYAVRGSLSTDPLSRPADVVWGTERETVQIFKDFTPMSPKEVKNSAGFPFDNLPERDRGYLTCQYTKNFSVADFRTAVLPAMAYDIIVNSTGFTIDGVAIPAKYARLEIRSAPRVIEGATTYYRVEFFIRFRQGHPGYATDGWEERYLDRGHYEVLGGAAIPIRDGDGQIVQDPWPLNGSGAALATPTAIPVTLGPFLLYPEVSFSGFGFA